MERGRSALLSDRLALLTGISTDSAGKHWAASLVSETRLSTFRTDPANCVIFNNAKFTLLDMYENLWYCYEKHSCNILIVLLADVEERKRANTFPRVQRPQNDFGRAVIRRTVRLFTNASPDASRLGLDNLFIRVSRVPDKSL